VGKFIGCTTSLIIYEKLQLHHDWSLIII